MSDDEQGTYETPDEGGSVDDGTEGGRDYAAAVSHVLDVAAVALNFVPGGKAPKLVARAARYLPRAKIVVDMAPDLVNTVASKAVEKAPQAKEAAVKAADAAKRGAGHAAKTVRGGATGVARAAKGASVAAGAKVGKAVSAARLGSHKPTRAQRTARERVIKGAQRVVTAQQFLDTWDEAEHSDGPRATVCGAFAILSCAKGTRDLAAFHDVLVGGGTDIAPTVFDHLTGRGNVDVYADVRYGQAVYVLVWPCEPSRVTDLRRALIISLDADSSYNAGPKA